MIGGSRPSENLTATVGSVVAAVLGVVAIFKPDFNLPPAAVASLVALIAWMAHAVTWFVARKLVKGELISAKDGEVTEA